MIDHAGEMGGWFGFFQFVMICGAGKETGVGSGGDPVEN